MKAETWKVEASVHCARRQTRLCEIEGTILQDQKKTLDQLNYIMKIPRFSSRVSCVITSTPNPTYIIPLLQP